MPELPDIAAYITALEPRIVGQPLQKIRLASAFLLRTVQPPLASAESRTVRELRRIGKRIAIRLDDLGRDGSEPNNDLWLVLHLMIAGRLHWRPPEAKLSGRQNLAAFDFPHGSLVLTEAGSKRRAALHLIAGEQNLRSLDAGGIDIFASDLDSFRATLTAENHTLKRALTDPRLLSGIGNAYSDEILHAAQLSPIALTHKLKPSVTPAAAFAALITLVPSTAFSVTTGPVSATVTLWLKLDVLPLPSLTWPAIVAVPSASCLAALEGIVALQLVPAPFTAAT